MLLVVAILLGLSEGGLIAYTLLYKYGTVPIRSVLVAAPIVGVVLYWWANTLEELLSMISALTIVAGVSTIVVYATPLYVLPDPSVAEQNVLLLDALNRTFLHLGLSTVLVVFGALGTAIAYRESLLPDRWLENRGRPNAGIALITVAIVLVAGILAVPMIQNYASAVDQQGVEASVDGEPAVALLRGQIPLGQVALDLGPDPVAHLPGGLAGEGDGHDAAQRRTIGQQRQIAGHQGPRLPRPRPRRHDDVAAAGGDGRALLRVWRELADDGVKVSTHGLIGSAAGSASKSRRPGSRVGRLP